MQEAPAVPFHIGLTADRVIDAAVDFTAESRLFSWSLRDLAARLDVAASVSIADDRLQHEGDGPRDHAQMMDEFQEVAVESDGVQAMGTEFMRPFAEGGAAAERMREAYYRFVMDTTIAGLDAGLRARPAGERA